MHAEPKPPITATVDELVKLLGKRPIIWLGADVALAAGYPTLGDLAEAMRRESSDPIDGDSDFAAVVDAFVASEGGGALTNLLNRSLAALHQPTAVHRAIARLAGCGALTTVVTSHFFDELMEYALREEGVAHVVQFTEHNPASDEFRVLKLHGSYREWRKVLLSGSSKDGFDARYRFVMAQLRSQLELRPIVFVGSSMRDPYLLDWLAKLDGDRVRLMERWRPMMTLPDWQHALEATHDGEPVRSILARGNIRPLVVTDYQERLSALWTEASARLAGPADASAGSEPGRRRWWLRSLSLERFKAVSGPELITLPPLTVIIGRNGSGKSTVLEALQWLDTALRRDIHEACDRYHGVSHLIHRPHWRGRSSTQVLAFEFDLRWSEQRDENPAQLNYLLGIEDRGQGGNRNTSGSPAVRRETLNMDSVTFLNSTYLLRRGREYNPETVFDREDLAQSINRDRLALGQMHTLLKMAGVDLVSGFWQRAVFLRLSPSKLALGGAANRKSFEPILDEDGQMLPTLLAELDDEQRKQLIDELSDILAFDIDDVSVSAKELGQQLFFSLHERVQRTDGFNGGTEGEAHSIPIPAWMLSEGTRRLTALLALLVRDPPPSLLCIEELENGLDPWTVRALLRHLQSAVDRGIQVIVTTHSPWVLDHVPLKSILHVHRDERGAHYQPFSSREDIQAYAAGVPAGTRYVQEGD